MVSFSVALCCIVEGKGDVRFATVPKHYPKKINRKKRALLANLTFGNFCFTCILNPMSRGEHFLHAKHPRCLCMNARSFERFRRSVHPDLSFLFSCSTSPNVPCTTRSVLSVAWSRIRMSPYCRSLAVEMCQWHMCSVSILVQWKQCILHTSIGSWALSGISWNDPRHLGTAECALWVPQE